MKSRTEGEQLEVNSISVRFSGLLALDSVSLQVQRGEILGLIGPNGAGKSTLVNVISGFQKADGRVVIDGVDLTSLSARQRARTGIRRTFQDVRLFQDMTVFQNVLVGALGAGMGREDARAATVRALDIFELGDQSELRAGDLPYGNERRLGIARAVVAGPRFALFDEPAAGLNEVESDVLMEVLRRAREAFGCGIVVVEHDMRLIFRLCERIHVLDHGVTLAVGDPEMVRRDPRVIEAYLGAESVA